MFIMIVIFTSNQEVVNGLCERKSPSAQDFVKSSGHLTEKDEPTPLSSNRAWTDRRRGFMFINMIEISVSAADPRASVVTTHP